MIPHGWQRDWRTPANGVTLLRIALTPLILMRISQGRHREAAAWFAFAALTDFLDGWLARSQSLISSTGQYLDPIADKVLLSGVFVALAMQGSAPVWFVALVLGRDVALVVASLIAMRVSSYHDYTPTKWGKLSTALQILAIIAILLANAEGSGRVAKMAQVCVLTAAAATGWSTVHYTWRGIWYFIPPKRRTRKH